ncbi:hypothetical protein AB0I39_07610 [Kitasatospora purpeofusca]|uniref:hypothetical protein n=1 Tax=Kitasatospora purpeofusca TaxID=67352 RepID=UPI0033FD1114
MSAVLSPASPGGLRWLAALHPEPTSCLDAWSAGRLAWIPLGTVWALRVSASIGYRLLHVLPPHGPVLHTVATSTAAFLVRPAAGLVVPAYQGELAAYGALPCPAPGRAVLEVRRGLPGARAAAGAPRWLVEPDGSGGLWDVPALLAAVGDEYQYLETLPVDEPHRGDEAAPATVTAPDADAFGRFHAAGRGS